MIECKSCRYWIDNKEWDAIMHPMDYDTDEEMRMPFEVRKCTHPSITLFERNPDPRGVSLTDGSMYHAAMYTGPEYGCVNGEV